MKRVTIFPNLIIDAKSRSNPYIQDYVEAINSHKDLSVANPPHKNPLKSILNPKKWGDIFIFNWFESIPDYKYGMLQSVVAIFFLLVLKLSSKKIVWMLHNRKPHSEGKKWMKKLLTNLIARNSSIIITHSLEGLELIKENYPEESEKTYFLHHPTVDRIKTDNTINEKKYDLLIWGTITPYKGIMEFIEYIKLHNTDNIKVCIIGRGNQAILDKIKKSGSESVTIIEESPSFDELADYISQTKFVLCTYNPESVLSSGMLMDSLSFGAKIIGPNVGSFKDYSKEPLLNVYTFNTFDEIIPIVKEKEIDNVSYDNYKRFLKENNWNNFISKLYNIINQN